ncbi:MAG: hypothetical protein QF765_06965 [Candidatus Marinimicrobia bacterium]|nr:hypothetical protein [Candidatus Neomarinimicrobiota bacterium]|tara:strand:- start:462 stop:1253 length:792 start_codon:yes stop_codon:yes gene_type:complete
MIIARIFPSESSSYKSLSVFFRKLDGFMKLKPLSWFAVWILMTSGTSAQQSNLDRYIYWDMSLAGVGLITLLIITIVMTFIIRKEKFSFISNDLNTNFILNHTIVGLVLFMTGWGWLNWLNGDLLISLKSFFPYLLTYLSLLFIYQIDLDSIPEKGYTPGKGLIVLSLLLVLVSVFIGIAFDDPVVSTAAAVIAPFYLIAIVFPEHKRHIERARIYPVFIAAMFVSVRLPWLLIPLGVLFFGLRTYHYFRYNIVFPTFAVDHD